MNISAHPLIGFCCALLLSMSAPAVAKTVAPDADASEVNVSVEAQVKAETQKQMAERRKKIVQDAVDALAETKGALKALDENRPEDALEALAVATGKLALVVARDRSLALAPVDVSAIRRDVLASKDVIEASIESAKRALEDGNVQAARRLLDKLASEVVITVTSLPLATFPDAIKSVTPLIDDEQVEAAKRHLQSALNTVVLTDYIVPLPVLRAEAMLEEAESLTENTERSAEESERLAALLQSSREQLEMADLLGYGDRDDYEDLYAQIEEIKERTADGESGDDFFNNVKQSMNKLWNSIFG